MSQALQTAELPPEALAIIKEGSPRPAPERLREVAPVPIKTEVRAAVMPNPIEPSKEAGEVQAIKPRGLVPLSVRVQGDLADTLLRVAFERKLQRRAPYSQQDIVIQAVTQWLKKNGY
ncbi:MAG TPA: hypothetical protein DCE44_11910 [Verrucomicrobiales bacterium]|nr:hypothetical protein [Verrucomicrobiales bacterium]